MRRAREIGGDVPRGFSNFCPALSGYTLMCYSMPENRASLYPLSYPRPNLPSYSILRTASMQAAVASAATAIASGQDEASLAAADAAAAAAAAAAAEGGDNDEDEDGEYEEVEEEVEEVVALPPSPPRPR